MLSEVKFQQIESGQYLKSPHNLKEARKEMGLNRPIVVGNYVTDEEWTIAVDGAGGPPSQIKNGVDWDFFQELQAQAGVINTGADYLNRFEKQGEGAQNVLSQFDEGAKYAALGDWRLAHGYKQRNPDVSVVSRSLDFYFPPSLAEGGRRFFVYTTHGSAKSEKATALKKKGAIVVGAGENGVDGKLMVEDLWDEGYEVAKLTTGPRALSILTDADVLDRLYVTRVRRIIPGEPDKLIRLPIVEKNGIFQIGGRDFKLMEPSYIHTGAKAQDGETITQEFLVFERSR